MKSADIFARAESRKDTLIEAMYERNNALAKERDALRKQNRSKRQILGGCWLCGSSMNLPEGLTEFSLPAPVNRLEGVLCKPCRNTRGDLPLVVAMRLWEATDLPKRWGWKPVPSSQYRLAVQGGFAVDREGNAVEEVVWTVAERWWEYTWAHHVMSARRGERVHDPHPTSKPFNWLS